MSSLYRPIVAIAGLNGSLGQQTLAALLSSQFINYFQLPIRVLTRNPSHLDGYVYSADMVWRNTLSRQFWHTTDIACFPLVGMECGD